MRGRFVVGFDGTDHCLIENGEVVFEGGRILYVGRAYRGTVSERVECGNAVIGPGFIDLDALADLDSTVINFDNHPWWAKGRVWPHSYLERGPRDVYSPDEEAFKMRYAFVQLLRNGITTAAPITSLHYRAWAETYEEFARVVDIAGDLGIRLYLGPAYRSGLTFVRPDGSLDRHFDEARGLEGLARAADFVRDFDGAHGGRVRGMLAPDRIETCTPRLLEETARAAAELDCPVRLHCCQSVYEFETVEQLHGTTPLGYAERSGLLRPRTLLPHGIYLSHHSQTRREPPDADLDRLARSGAAVVHCPVVMMRLGHVMESFVRLRGRGITIALGTDTYPPDLLENMRVGVGMCRMAERAPDASSAADFYRAATLGGADALGRPDLGRLAPGAKADITAFDLDDDHIGQLVDPIQTMILNGRRGGFNHVVVDGRCVVRAGRMEGIDFASLQRQAQHQFDRLMASYPERSFGHPPIGDILKPSFRFAEEITRPEEREHA